MKIGTKLFAGFGIILLLLVTLWGAGRWGFTSYQGAVSVALSGDLKIMEHADNIRAHALGLRRFEKDMFINIGSAAEVEKYYSSWNGELSELKTRIEGLESIVVQPEDVAMVKALKFHLGQYETGVGGVYRKIQSGEIRTTRDANQAMAAYKEASHKLVEETKDHAREASARMEAEAERLAGFSDRISKLTLGISIAALLAGMATAALITRSICRPLNRMRLAISSIEKDHDFTRRILIDSNDEVGQTARAFNNLIAVLQQSLSQVVVGVSRVSGAAQTLSTSSTQVAQSSSAQSEAASSMAAAVEQMTVSISQVSESAREAVDISRKSGELSSAGGGIIQSASSEMSKIAENVRHTAEVIEQLGAHSNEISSIVQVIKEVADQTNLLALNAAIEAARAGEQGRGFAVVADEVRALAGRTQQSTAEIRDMLERLQRGSQTVVAAMEGTKESCRETADKTARVHGSLDQVVDAVVRSNDLVSQIATAAEQQSLVADEISRNMHAIAEVVAQLERSGEEVAAGAGTMEQSYRALRDIVGRFRLR